MKKKILVIDNDILILKFIDNVLSKEGHQLVQAEDSLSALDILKTYTPDVIITDLVMPNIDGKKLCKIVRSTEKLKDVYLVILSAAMAESEIEVSELGADMYIAKGPIKEMAANIILAVNRSDRSYPQPMQNEVLGIETIKPRGITKELISVANQFEIILEKMSEGIMKVTSLGKIVYANSKAISLSNRPEEKLLGSYFTELFNKNDIRLIKELMHEKRNKAKSLTKEKPLLFHGHQVTLDILPIEEDAKSSIIILNDVKELRQAEEEKKKLEAQLQHAQKMEAVGIMASGVAHNFRNILAGILANSEMIQILCEENTELHKNAKGINSAVKMGSHLVDGLLQFSQKKGAGGFRVFNLSDLISRTCNLITKSFHKNIETCLDLPGLLPVSCDPSTLSQVLINLITNARDAMPHGGRLDIRAGKKGNRVELIVSDTGCGMNGEVRAKCFDPFFTTKDIGKGAGLGLSTSYGIVRDHGGEIQVYSEPGKGASFKLYFPLASSRDVVDEKEEDAGIVRGRGEKILLVDDEIEVLSPIRDLLEASGYSVRLAFGGKEAIERYRTWKPDIVIMDIRMPEMDGITGVRKILKYDQNAKIVFMSGYDEEGIGGLNDSLKKSIKGYLTKPINSARLSNVLAGILKNGLTV